MGRMPSPEYLTRVAIVGAGGNAGRQITASLLKGGKHTVTALTRADSKSVLPLGVVVKQIEYEKHATLVQALEGQEALVITLSGAAPPDTEMKLVRAAAEAGVQWILPSEWAPDTANEDMVKDVWIFQPKVAIREAILDLGKSCFIAVSTGFWYEYMQSMPGSFGFDFEHKTALFFDDGQTPVSFSTLPQVGRAVAALLSLPITARGNEPCLEKYRNQVVYINSFTITQQHMLASAMRVTGTSEDDWTVDHVSSRRRYEQGLEEKSRGERKGFAKVMCARVFFPDGCGDFEHNKGTLNGVLGLQKQSLDDATREAVQRAKKMADWQKMADKK